jgi:alpha-ketoglutarate-dependent taurine dioxygenase
LDIPDGGDSYFNEKIKAVMDERAAALKLVGEYEAAHSGTEQAPSPIPTLDVEPFALTRFDETLTRQLIDTIRVNHGGTLQITLKGGEQIQRRISTNRREMQCESQTFAMSQLMS